MSQSSSDGGGESIATVFYRTQVIESKIGWIVSIAVVGIFVFTVLFVLLSLRGHYIDLVNRFGSFGMICAVAHTYPFLSSIFFKNPNTPDIVMSVFYGITGSGGAPGTLAWSPGFNWDTLVNPSSWRDQIGTIVWYAESNYTLGYEDVVVNWATKTQNYFVGNVSTFQKDLNSFMTYGLPILNTLLMIAMMIPK